MDDMSRHDWYRKRTWSKEDQGDFFLRLKRVRSSKAQILFIQAGCLVEEYPDEAIKLLNILFQDYPEPIHLGIAYLILADCYRQKGMIQEAVNAYRASLEAERKKPNIKTNAFLDFGLFVVQNELTDLYGEADQVLNEFSQDGELFFPFQKYMYSATKAIICFEGELFSTAKEYAKFALLMAAQTASGLSYHSKLGLVGKQSPDLQERLNKVANLEVSDE